MTSRPRPSLLYLLALSVIATLIFALYFWLGLQNHFSELEPLLNGTAPRPYVARVLAPWLIRLISGISGARAELVAMMVMYGSLVGFSYTFAKLADLWLPFPYARIAGFLAPVGLIPFLISQRHIYDLPTLFLFTLAFYFLATRNLRNYLWVFVLATLSKETSLFLVFFYAIQFRAEQTKKYLFWAALQLLIYLLIRLPLLMMFRRNPGGILEWHFYEHVEAYALYPVSAIFLFGSICLVIAVAGTQSAEPTSTVRNYLMAVGGPILVLYFFFGVPFELRVFLEAYPSIFLLLSFALLRLRERAPRRSPSAD